MVITPNSDVILLKCPLELDQANQLNFASATAQYNYFYGLPKLVAGTNLTYIRKDGYIKVPAKFDALIEYNYVMYRNTNYSNKWFYAFITKMEYANDNMTYVYIKTDCYQTWQFDLTYKSSFVEREHVNDDTIGKHTVPESLETGEYQIVDANYSVLYERPSADGFPAFLPCFCVSKLPGTLTTFTDETTTIGSVFSTLHFFAVRNFSDARKIIKGYDEDSATTSDAIINVYMVPRCCVDFNPANSTIASTGNAPTNCYDVWIYPILDSYTSDERYIQEPNHLAGNYQPKNNKLFCFPYSYFYATNKCGTEVEYHWEDFPTLNMSGTTAKTAKYKKVMVPSTSISAKLYFTNYKGWSDDTYATRLYNYGITFAKVPVCAWTTDYYTNWLTQNGVNNVIQKTLAGASGAANVLGSMMLGDVKGAITSGINAASRIADLVHEEHVAETTPPQAHGDINTGDVMFAYARNTIAFYQMSVRPEMAAVIDGYFSMYGYKVNTVKVPNTTGRANWNYIKTVGCYILADIPQEDLQEIKNMFDNGLTIWHNPSTFRDYSQSNAIVS